jgi:hypothetical protein
MTSLSACETLPNEGKAAAILDAAVPASRDHAEALVGDNVDLMRVTGLELITVVNCWPDGC